MDDAEALTWARKYLDAAAKLQARFPDQEKALEQLSDAHTDVGYSLANLGDLKASLAEYQKATAARERLSAGHPYDVVRRRDLMLAYGHVAAILEMHSGPTWEISRERGSITPRRWKLPSRTPQPTRKIVRPNTMSRPPACAWAP